LLQVARDLVEVRRPSAAATAEDVEVRISLRQRAHALAEIDRVAVLDMAELAKVDLVLGAGVRPQAAYPTDPVARFERRFEFERVRTVDAVKIGTRVPRFGIDRFDRLLEARARFQTMVAVERKRYLERQADSRGRARRRPLRERC
jgi:hypothetical protein